MNATFPARLTERVRESLAMDCRMIGTDHPTLAGILKHLLTESVRLERVEDYAKELEARLHEAEHEIAVLKARADEAGQMAKHRTFTDAFRAALDDIAREPEPVDGVCGMCSAPLAFASEIDRGVCSPCFSAEVADAA